MSLTFMISTIVLVVLVIAISFVDVREMRIPDWLNASLLGGGVVASMFVQHQSVWWALASAAAAFLLVWMFSAGFRHLRGRNGLGLGDVKFAGASASWIGLAGLPTMLFVASIATLTLVVGLRLRGTVLQGNDKIPFGPFLGVGLIIVWCFGPLRLA